MELISVNEKAEFENAIKDVTDTFFKATVVFKNMSNTFSRFGNKNNATATNNVLLARVTALDNTTDEAKQSINGVEDMQNVEIRFNANDLRTAGLMVDNKPLFDVHKDYFEYNGNEYLLRLVSFDDTDFAGKYMIVVCTCEKQPLKA